MTSFKTPQNNKLVELLGQAKALSRELNRFMKEKNHLEEEFLSQYRGKPVVLLTLQGEERGILTDMNRFRVEIASEGREKFFNKGSLLGFYAEA